MKVAVSKKPQKKRRWPFVLLLVIAALVLPIAALFIFVYDANTKQLNIPETQTVENIANNITVDSLDSAPTDHKLNFVVTEKDMDAIIDCALRGAGAKGGVVKKAYVYVHENRYAFYVDLDLRVFKTRIKFDTLLEETSDKMSFVFSIRDITIGRVSGFKNISTSFLGSFVNTSSINSFIKKIGLSAKYSGEDLSFTYNKIDLINDIVKFTNNGSIDLYNDVLETIIRDEIFYFNLKSQNFAEGIANLEPFHENMYVTDYVDQIKIQPSQVGERCRDKMVQLVNEHKFNVNEIAPVTVFKFLFSGYNNITAHEREQIDGIDMSSIGINDKTNYKGFDLVKPEYELHHQLTQSVNIDNMISRNPSINKPICRLSETGLNNYLASRNIVGYTSLLSKWDGDQYKANFITIDNLYCNIYNDEDKIAEFVCKLNINGYHTALTFTSKTIQEEQEDFKMIFKVQRVDYGSVKAQVLEHSFFELLHTALLDGDGTLSAITVDETTHSIIFNFSTILEETKQRCEAQIYEEHGMYVNLSSYFQNSNLDYTIYGSSRSSDSTIELSMKTGINY